MVTTIQLSEQVKRSLDHMKETGKETYEEVIVSMMQKVDEQKRRQRMLLIEGCKEMATDSLQMLKEFEHADAEIDWERNEH